MRRAVVTACALVLVSVVGLGACGRADEAPAKPVRTIEPRNTASSPSVDPDRTKNSAGCKLLTPGERRSIAGQDLDIVVPVPVLDGLLACKWVESLRTPLTTSIRVISQPVQRLLQALPQRIDDLLASGKAADKFTGRLKRARKEIIRGADEISDKKGCRYFSLLVEANNEKQKGVTEGLLYQGTARGDFTVSWQRCSGGVHTELVYEEPELQVSLALSQAAIRLGRIAHQRAVKLL